MKGNYEQDTFFRCLISAGLTAYFYQNEYQKLALVAFGFAVYYLYWYLPTQKVKGGENFHVIVIGSGISGINAGKVLADHGIRYTILEKSSKLGGTWYDNTYPGCACDVPSHLYSFSFYTNPWWSRAYSKQIEIRTYLEEAAGYFGIYPHIKFNKRVKTTEWSDKTKKWMVVCEDGETFVGNAIISGNGALHVPNMPTFEGQDDFKGRKFHSAEWPKDISLKNKKVAVVGTGASAVQIVPNIVDEVKSLTVFQRTAAWSPPRFDFEYPEWVKLMFHYLPFTLTLHRWFYYWRAELRFYILFDKRRRSLAKRVMDTVKDHYRSVIKDPELVKKLIPDYDMGCKRITPSDTYLKAFNNSHVTLETDPIQRFTESGIKTANKEYDFDIIVYATGYSIHKSAVEAYKAKGPDGKILQEEWGDAPAAYKGIVSPGYPNMFYLLGPNTGLGHNSIIYVIECQVNYAIDCIRKLIASGNREMDCKKEVFEDYQSMIFRRMKDRVFYDGCLAWYRNARGINWTLWPSDLEHYWWITKSCNMSDYNVR